jgi:ABC-type sugar transport system substrate-binding protein
MENYLQMGADLILNVAMDVESCKDITLRCIEEGCFVIMLGVWPDYEISGGLIADFRETGEAAALMLIDWAEKNYEDAGADSLPVAVLTATSTSDALKRSAGFLETIDAGEKTFVDYQEVQLAPTPEAGFTFAENALTYNPNIRLFLTYEIDPGMGANNYIIQRPDFNIEEFCVIGVGQTAATLELIEQSGADPASSCLRGSLSYGGPDPGIQLNEVSYKLLIEKVDPPYWMYDDLYTINSWGWELPAYFND